MDDRNEKNGSNYIKEPLPISLINQIIINYDLEKDKFKTEIKDTSKIIEKLDNFLNKKLIPKYYSFKFNKFLTFINNTKNISKKKYNESKEMMLKEKIIFVISICFLRININKFNHYKIKKYLRVLLFFYINGIISIENYFFILEVILISIIEMLKKKQEKKYQIFEINKEPLLFIKYIIETIINYPIMMMNNNILIERLINVFNKIFERAENLNIIIKEDELWLKLFENNSIKESFEFYNDNSYQKSIKIILNFLKRRFKNNIPNKLYDEIYKKSSIDLIYYINILTMLKELIKTK